MPVWPLQQVQGVLLRFGRSTLPGVRRIPAGSMFARYVQSGRVVGLQRRELRFASENGVASRMAANSARRRSYTNTAVVIS